VRLSLPISWANEPPPTGASVFSRSPDTSSSVELDVSAYSGTPAEFTAAAYRAARQTYLAQDPKARIRSQTVALPAGRVFEVTARLVRRAGSRTYPLSVIVYTFLRGGKLYQFVYITLTPKVGTYVPIFERSARSIRFG
jgi:hypothetical protein